MSRDNLRARLAAHAARQPYTFNVGNRVYQYDPISQKSTLLTTRPTDTTGAWKLEADGWHYRKESHK